MSFKETWREDPYLIVGALSLLISFPATILGLVFDVPEILKNSAGLLLVFTGGFLIVSNIAIAKIISSPKGKSLPVGALLLTFLGVLTMICGGYMLWTGGVPMVLIGVTFLVAGVIVLKTIIDVID